MTDCKTLIIKTVGLWIIFINTLLPVSTVLGNDNTGNKQTVGNILGISGWYERYANGQIVLYPLIGNSSYGMSSMYGLPNTMSNLYNMLGMSGLYSMSGMGGTSTENPPEQLPKTTQSTAPNSTSNPPKVTGMQGMMGMLGMQGMIGMMGMQGMIGMYGLSGSYQMTFGRFWITKEGQLTLYPVSLLETEETSDDADNQ